MRNLKKVLALVLAMAMSLSLAVTAGAAYKDGDKISDEYAVAVEVASQLGILEGFEDGTYGPQKTLTRAQLATMTYRLATGDVEDVYTADFAGGAAEKFSDVTDTAWYAGYVAYAADAGYLKGVGTGEYKPASAMTGYQALAAFLRVVGYNQPGQFTGADWTVQVAQVAYEIGALEGISNVDLNAAISREVAAQIIFNILFADLVDYTPAFGYQNAWGEDDLATEIFDIVKDDSVVAATAPWGQPADEWYNTDGDAVVSIPYAPVAEYTVAIDECNLAKDLGLDEDGDVIVEYLNGNDKAEVVVGAINLLDTKTEIGAQGTLTEVYDIDGDFWFVQIETWLGQINDTRDAEFDKNGHEKKAAEADLTIFETSKAVVTLETDEFDVDDYVLINYSAMEDEYYLTETAPVATAEQTYIDAGDEFSTIGGKDYNWAAHYHMGFPGLVKTEYNVFVDFYGNLIGLSDIPEVEPEYTIFEDAILVTNGRDPYVDGQIVDLTDGSFDSIVVGSYDAFSAWTDDAVTKVHAIVGYTVNDDGEYDMFYAADYAANDYSIVNGTPRIVAGSETFVTDNNTVFAVENECEYTIYTGYKAVPSVAGVGIGAIEVLDEDNDGYVDLVYVDATNAIFAGEETFAFVTDDVAAVGVGNLANGHIYKSFDGVVINGEVVKVKCAPGLDLTKYYGLPVTLKADTDGLIVGVEVLMADYVPFEAVVDNSDEVVYLDATGNGYVVTADSIIWIINDDGTVEVGSADDIDAGVKGLVDLDGEKVETIIVLG